MKKILLLILTILMLFGCEMYKTTNVTIKNSTAFDVVITARNFKEDDKKIREYNLTIKSGKVLNLPLYNDGEITLESIGRYSLYKNSSTSYEIKDILPEMFIFFNKTTDTVTVKELNGLFNSVTINPGQKQENVQVFNSPKLRISATTSDGILLKHEQQGNNIIIKY